MKRLFFDVETTGLDPLKHQILTAAFALYEGDHLVDTLRVAIKTSSWAKIEPRALEVNGIDLSEHNKTALSEETAVQQITVFVRDNLLYRARPHGHNVSFDIGFLQALFARVGKQYPFHYHFGDSMIFALALMDAGVLSQGDVRLQSLCERFGVAADWHTAMGDTMATAKLYNHLLRIVRGSAGGVS